VKTVLYYLAILNGIGVIAISFAIAAITSLKTSAIDRGQQVEKVLQYDKSDNVDHEVQIEMRDALKNIFFVSDTKEMMAKGLLGLTICLMGSQIIIAIMVLSRADSGREANCTHQH
jgi:hypothetical protein